MTNRNIEEAREYIINEIIPMFRDRTFEKYVSTRLASDFAIELAKAWVKERKEIIRQRSELLRYKKTVNYLMSKVELTPSQQIVMESVIKDKDELQFKGESHEKIKLENEKINRASS